MTRQFSEVAILQELLRYVRALAPVVPRRRLDPIRLTVLEALEDARHGQKKSPAGRAGPWEGVRSNDERHHRTQ